MRIETLSTFPDMFSSVMSASMMRLAREKGILDFRAYDLRNWAHDRHHSTDDAPYGGGSGQVMKPEPIFEACEDICSSEGVGCSAAEVETSQPANDICPYVESTSARPYIVFLAPHGEKFSDAIAQELALRARVLFVCGHYEGIDERAYSLADRVLSIGDYVLTSGELAAMVVIDAVVRKIPGVLGGQDSLREESFSDNLLEYPHYTRPAVYRQMSVPEVLLSGNHAEVQRWRHRMSLLRTAAHRPDLLDEATLEKDDLVFLKTCIASQNLEEGGISSSDSNCLRS